MDLKYLAKQFSYEIEFGLTSCCRPPLASVLGQSGDPETDSWQQIGSKQVRLDLKFKLLSQQMF